MAVMARVDELRLLAKVARMYYVQDLDQKSITNRLQVHQSTVSRMLKRARALNVVRFSVVNPPGTYSELEDQLAARFSLMDVVVVDCPADEEAMLRDLGAALAYYIETTIKPKMTIGISSWSRALFSMVDALHPKDYCRDGKVVQILGGVGNVGSEYQAIYIAQRLAAAIGATPVLLQAPAVVGSQEAQRILIREASVQQAAALFGSLDVAFVGIGSMEPSKMLASSGNVFSREERQALRKLGAVGDICFRFFDRDGKPVRSPLSKRVIGIEFETLRATPRVVGVAGGLYKAESILAALRGNWINVLITDRRAAEKLMDESPRNQT